MTLNIEIIGCSAAGAALCYRTICEEGPALLGPHVHPEVSMHTPSVADYVRHLQSGDWAGIGTLMLASALEVQAAGADFLICPDNTIHAALPLIGTRWLVESEVYQQKLQARASLCASAPCRARRNQPHHNGGIRLRLLQAKRDRLPSTSDRADEDRHHVYLSVPDPA